jgi:hypothetical protein
MLDGPLVSLFLFPAETPFASNMCRWNHDPIVRPLFSLH